MFKKKLNKLLNNKILLPTILLILVVLLTIILKMIMTTLFMTKILIISNFSLIYIENISLILWMMSSNLSLSFIILTILTNLSTFTTKKITVVLCILTILMIHVKSKQMEDTGLHKVVLRLLNKKYEIILLNYLILLWKNLIVMINVKK